MYRPSRIARGVLALSVLCPSLITSCQKAQEFSGLDPANFNNYALITECPTQHQVNTLTDIPISLTTHSCGEKESRSLPDNLFVSFRREADPCTSVTGSCPEKHYVLQSIPVPTKAVTMYPRDADCGSAISFSFPDRPNPDAEWLFVQQEGMHITSATISIWVSDDQIQTLRR